MDVILQCKLATHNK